MLLNTEGIVIKTTKYGDNSIITNIYSKEKGLITLIVARKSGKRINNAHYLQALSLLDITYYFKPNQTIHRAKEFSWIKGKEDDFQDVGKNAIRFFIAELLGIVIQEIEGNSSLFQFLKANVLEINESDKLDPLFLINFLLNLSKSLGFQPDTSKFSHYFDLSNGEFVEQKPNHTHFLDKATSTLLKNYFTSKESYNKIERKTLLNAFLDYFRVQLDKNFNLKSKEVLEQLFN